MTATEKAIDKLLYLLHRGQITVREMEEADSIIESLKKELNKTTREMTREEAIEELEQRLSTLRFLGGTYVDCVNGEALEMALEALKQQERKKAKWSEKGVSFACTNCDYRVMEPVNCCPNCGAEMEGEE